MELNSNSFSAKLYCWFYDKRSFELPESLCPYFWKLLIAYVVVIPYCIFALPVLWLNNWRNESIARGVFGSILAYALIYMIFTFLLIPYGLVFGLAKSAFIKVSFNVGIQVWVVFIIVFLSHSISWLYKFITNKKFKPKKPNLLKEFTLAKINKVCPKITWK